MNSVKPHPLFIVQIKSLCLLYVIVMIPIFALKGLLKFVEVWITSYHTFLWLFCYLNTTADAFWRKWSTEFPQTGLYIFFVLAVHATTFGISADAALWNEVSSVLQKVRLARIRLAKKGTTNAFLQYKEEGGLQVSNYVPVGSLNGRDHCGGFEQ